MKIQELFAGLWVDGSSCNKIIPLLVENGCKFVRLDECSPPEKTAPVVALQGAPSSARPVHDGSIVGDRTADPNGAALIFVAAVSAHESDALACLTKVHDAAPATEKIKLIADAIERWIQPATRDVEGGLAPWQIARVKALVELRLGDHLTASDLAAAARLSPSYFSRRFKQSFRDPPHLYLMKCRISRAKQLMATTTCPLSEIALICGLSDQSHLSRIFRRLEGATPSRWRRRMVPALRKAGG
jgi:AraC-like DNA-binding protein